VVLYGELRNCAQFYSGLAQPKSLKGGKFVQDQRNKRTEQRKFRRILLYFGLQAPEYRATGIQISSRGLFISTNYPIYAPGTKIMIETSFSKGSYTVQAIVRHAKKVPRLLTSKERSGMGIEFISPPPELMEYLTSM
jgi:hypothetical protein